MNSTYKVVFSKARGVLMVVNELTSSVQAKGTKTVIAAAAALAVVGMSSIAEAADPTIIASNTTITVSAENWITPPLGGFELQNNAVLTITGVGHEYGFIRGENPFLQSVTGNGSLVLIQTGPELRSALGEGLREIAITGSLTITSEDRGFYKNRNVYGGGNYKIQAKTIDITAADDAIFTTDNEDFSVEGFDTLTLISAKGHAVNNNGTATLTFNGGNATLTANNRGALSTMGSGAKTEFTVNSLNVEANINNQSGLRKISAVYVTNSGTLDVTAADRIDIKLTKSEGQEQANGLSIEDGGNLRFKAKTILIDAHGNTALSSSEDAGVTLIGDSTIYGDVDSQGNLGVAGSLALGGKTNFIATLDNAQTSRSARTFAARAVADQIKLTILNPNSTTTIGTNNTDLLVTAGGEVNDAVGGIDGFLANTFSIDSNPGSAQIRLEEGLVEGSVTAALDENGDPIEGTVVERINSVQESTLDLTASIPLTITRALTNDVRKRLGDIRSAQGTHGVWARYDGGKMSDSADFDHKFNTVQIGIDTLPTPDAARFGVAFSYTQGDTDFARGKSDMDAFSLAAYGTWLGDNGLFADVIGRIAAVKNDMTVGQYKGKTDSTVLSLSGELGWRYDVTNMLYVEPQAELTYTYIDGDSFKLGYADYETDSVDSLVGRAGFALGVKCPNNKGDAYVRVSAVHEFLGDSKVTARGGSAINTAEFDGKDTWVEYGIGASYNVTPNTYIWADIERTSGAVVDEDVRGTVGVRYSF